MTITFNRPVLKDRRRDLRKNLTDAERKLWLKLRNKQLYGLKFFRQYGAGSYILDFFCPAVKLAVELDGGQHAQPRQISYDKNRTLFLKSRGIKIIRFWDDDVLKNTEGVLLEISRNLTPPAPSLEKEGEKSRCKII